MPEPRDLHRGSTVVMSAILVVLGVAIVVRTLAAGGGGLAIGLLLGVLFVAAGLGRLYLNARIATGRAGHAPAEGAQPPAEGRKPARGRGRS